MLSRNSVSINCYRAVEESFAEWIELIVTLKRGRWQEERETERENVPLLGQGGCGVAAGNEPGKFR